MGQETRCQDYILQVGVNCLCILFALLEIGLIFFSLEVLVLVPLLKLSGMGGVTVSEILYKC